MTQKPGKKQTTKATFATATENFSETDNCKNSKLRIFG